ncbi:hypothetical protein ACQUSY_03915 [Microbacterium sp. YY-03]|uniref:hypothetical protein n=1 Tax=Microbacterium sp. YY-03 TaxID=3421636 RepID=UPI003D17A9C0
MTEAVVPHPSDPGASAWRELFASGQSWVVPFDRAAALRRLRGSVVVMVGCAVVIAAWMTLTVVILTTGFVAPAYAWICGLLAVAFSFIFVRFYLTHRRMRIARASTAEYLVVSAEGLRVAGHVTVPWSVVGGGIGVDARNEVQPAYRAFAVGVEQYAGVMQAEFALSVRGVRSLRDAAPRDLRALFEVIGTHGGIRIPIDTMVPPVHVVRAMEAICVAGLMSGANVEISSDRGRVFTRVMDVLGPGRGRYPIGEGRPEWSGDK